LEQGSTPLLLLLVGGGSFVRPVPPFFVVTVLNAVAAGDEQAVIVVTLVSQLVEPSVVTAIVISWLLTSGVCVLGTPPTGDVDAAVWLKAVAAPIFSFFNLFSITNLAARPPPTLIRISRTAANVMTQKTLRRTPHIVAEAGFSVSCSGAAAGAAAAAAAGGGGGGGAGGPAGGFKGLTTVGNRSCWTVCW
jgi:hypothetical protein